MGVSKFVYRGETKFDISRDTVTAEHLEKGYTAHGADGEPIEGTLKAGGDDNPYQLDRTKPVRFFDYDGVLLHSFSLEELAAMTALPANPSREGLTAQGWNWTLADAKECAPLMGGIDIGQNYVTDDGKTRFYITIPEDVIPERMSFIIRCKQTASRSVTFDWGDGTVETFTGTSNATRTHTYASPGDYVITLAVSAGNTLTLGYSSSYGAFGPIRRWSRCWVRKAEIGERVEFAASHAFYYCNNLESVSLPAYLTSIGDTGQTFRHCYRLKFIAVPSGVSTIGTFTFAACAHEQFHVSLPKSARTFGASLFAGDFQMRRVFLPPGTDELPASLFENNHNIYSQWVPETVTAVGNSAFYGCYGMTEIHFLSDSPPAIGTSVFGATFTALVIYVPYSADHAVLTAYQNATNWSEYAAKIQEEAV